MSLFIIRFKASVQQYAEIRHKLIKQILVSIFGFCAPDF